MDLSPILLLLPFPGRLAAILAVPYILLAWPYRSVADAESERRVQSVVSRSLERRRSL